MTTVAVRGRDTVAELAADFAARAGDHDRDGSFPFENFERLRDAGLLSLTVPVEYGGRGAGLEAVCRVVEVVAMGDASTALVLGMHYLKHAAMARERSWPEVVHRRLCRESVEGIALINTLQVEPDLGTPSRGGRPATTAERVGDGWRISGHKIYSTGAPILRWLLVGASTADDEPRVGTFLVRADTPGVRIVETWDHLGMRATGSHDVVFQGAVIPAEHALGLRPATARAAPSPLGPPWSNLVLSALYHGVARAARNWLVGYLNERVPTNLGAPLASLPRFQAAVGEIEALLYTNDRLIYGAACDVEASPPPEDTAGASALVKHTATANAIRSVEIGIGLIGNPGLSRQNPIERHYRDVLCSRVHFPQDDVILGQAGRSALEARPT